MLYTLAKIKINNPTCMIIIGLFSTTTNMLKLRLSSLKSKETSPLFFLLLEAIPRPFQLLTFSIWLAFFSILVYLNVHYIYPFDLLTCFDMCIIYQLRFGKVNKYISNTNVFEHSGKLYSIAENHMPQEINISTLETLGNWHLSSAWNRPFTSHPKVYLTSTESILSISF